jgi:diadenosine tetraphosphate (Ap4A) HIT family hydrolase
MTDASADGGADPAPCPLCADIAGPGADRDPWFVARLGTGDVRLARTQYYPGAVFFVAHRCVREPHDLPHPERGRHLLELAAVGEAVAAAFRPRKLNVESLGNGVPHLHWWVTPRYDDDRHPRGPIWENLEFLRELWLGGRQPGDAERRDLVARLRRALDHVDLPAPG